MKPYSLRGITWAVATGCAVVAIASFALAVQAGVLVNKTPLDGTQASSQESNLADLVADSLRDSAHGEADLALLPASELRAVAVPAGNIGSQDLVDSLRASSDNSDTVVLMHLTGAQIKKALAHGLSRLPAPYAGFLQVSGIRLIYTMGSHGPEVSSISLTDLGAPISDTKTYTVAASRLLADGALGYFEVWDKSDIVRDTGVPLSNALTDFAQSHQPLNYHVEDRITSR